MALIKKTIEVEAHIGDEIKTDMTVFRDDLRLFIIDIQGDLLFISYDINATRDECETVFVEDCIKVN